MIVETCEFSYTLAKEKTSSFVRCGAYVYFAQMQSQQARFLKSLVLTPARGCIGLESKPLECEGLAADKGRGGDGGGATAGSGEHQTSGCSEARRRDWVEEGGWGTTCENAHCCKDSEDQALQNKTSLKSFQSTEKRLWSHHNLHD